MKTFMDTSFFAQFNLEIYRNPVRPTMSDTAAGPEIKPTYIQHRPVIRKKSKMTASFRMKLHYPKLNGQLYN